MIEKVRGGMRPLDLYDRKSAIPRGGDPAFRLAIDKVLPVPRRGRLRLLLQQKRIVRHARPARLLLGTVRLVVWNLSNTVCVGK